MTSSRETYAARLARFRSSCPETIGAAHKHDLTTEAAFERLADFAVHGSVTEARDWLLAQRADPPMTVERIPLNQCHGWVTDPHTGNVMSETGDFFVVEGVRVTAERREVSSGWDQPIVTQVGYDGGILGTIRQRHEEVPQYLVEAKAEPGNPGVVQLSPTLQATYANLRRSHGGRLPKFVEYFLRPEDKRATVLVDRWVSEDGGRLMNKRNRVMLVEVAESVDLVLPDGFRWMSLHQLCRLIDDDEAFVGPHIRSLVSLL